MRYGQALVATACAAVLMTPPGFAEQSADLRAPQSPPNGGFFSNLRRPYQARTVPVPSYSNSARLDALIRAGKIYLSLDDAIALALENNLDIEVGRYAGDPKTLELIEHTLTAAGAEFLDENGGGPGVRLKRSKRETRKK